MLSPGPAAADPQVTAGVTAGAVVENVVGPSGPGASLHVGERADMLLRAADAPHMGLGPYVDVASAGFRDLDLGGGLSWLVPVTQEVPLVLSAGAFARDGQGRSWAPGVEATVFAGSRDFNYHSAYGLAAGVFAQSRWVPATPSSVDLIVGVQVDLELLALPWLLAWQALTHGS